MSNAVQLRARVLAAAPIPGLMSSHGVVVAAPITFPIEVPVVVGPPISSLIIKVVKVATTMGVSRFPIIRIVVPLWSTSIPTTFAGVVTVHKLRAFLIFIGLSSTTSLSASLVSTTDEDQNRQPSNNEKAPESYKLHNLYLRCLT